MFKYIKNLPEKTGTGSYGIGRIAAAPGEQRLEYVGKYDLKMCPFQWGGNLSPHLIIVSWAHLTTTWWAKKAGPQTHGHNSVIS